MSTLVEITGGLVYLEIITLVLLLATIILKFIVIRQCYHRQQFKLIWRLIFLLMASVAGAAFIIGKIYGQLSMIN